MTSDPPIRRHALGEGPRLTGREMDAMSVIWELPHPTVAVLRLALDTPLAYTTVLTVLQRLERKGCVTHDVEGQRFIYDAVLARDTVAAVLLRHLAQRFFDGSVAAVFSSLLAQPALVPRQLRPMGEILSAAAAVRVPVP